MLEPVRRLGDTLLALRSSPTALLKFLAALAALAMVAYRFANFDLVPFILDEPYFLTAAREQVLSGHWVSASPIQGTQGTTYGPTVLWFYGVVHQLFGSAPQTSILAMCALVTLSHVALAVALTRLFRGDALFLAALLALVAASPYQFFWSRLAWDQMVNVGASCTVALLCLPGPPGWIRRVALGLVLGFAISSHLMVLPLVALTFAVLALEQLPPPPVAGAHARARARRRAPGQPAVPGISPRQPSESASRLGPVLLVPAGRAPDPTRPRGLHLGARLLLRSGMA